MRTIPMADIRERYESGSNGGHWFDRDTMGFFKSVLPHRGYEAASGTVYFVSGETGPSGVQRFTVRTMPFDGSWIRTVGAFGAYGSSEDAHDAARNLACE